jgi:hypothetical protein
MVYLSPAKISGVGDRESLSNSRLYAAGGLFVSTRSPNELSARMRGDDVKLPPRLVFLVDEVLREMEMPADGSTDVEMLLALSAAFSDWARSRRGDC